MSSEYSWSADYCQDYEELICHKKSKMPTANPDVKIYFNPQFVADILCPDGSGNLATIFQKEDAKSEYQCYFVAKNSQFVAGIEYPSTEELDTTPKSR